MGSGTVLIEIDSGRELQRWPHLQSGRQTGSILVNTPALSLSRSIPRQRCAIADANGITILQFDVDS